MLVNAGETIILNKLASGFWMAVGTNGAAPTMADTTLGTELARVPVQVYTVSGHAGIQFDAYFTSSQVGGQTLREVGLFDAAVAGNMLCRSTITPVSVPVGSGALGTVQVTITGS